MLKLIFCKEVFSFSKGPENHKSSARISGTQAKGEFFLNLVSRILDKTGRTIDDFAKDYSNYFI